MVGCLEHNARLRSAIECCAIAECNGNAEHANLRVLAFEFTVLVGIGAVGANIAPYEFGVTTTCRSHLAVH